MPLPNRSRHTSFQPLPWLGKALVLLLILVCLILGIIGVLLPVIPGVLFFFLAALLCTRVSRRAFHYAHQNGWYRRQLNSWHRSNQLPVLSRAKLAMLVAIRSLVDVVIGLGRLLAKRRKTP